MVVSGAQNNNYSVEVTALVTDADLHRIEAGAKAKFISENPAKAHLDLTVSEVDSTALRLMNALPELSSQYAGPVATHSASAAGSRFGADAGQVLVPQEALYRVALKGNITGANEVNDLGVMRGNVVIDAQSASPALRALQYALSVVLRESGF